MIGTTHYMAPEQLEGDSVSPAADMRALGATLYTAVEGTPPFNGPTADAAARALAALCSVPDVAAIGAHAAVVATPGTGALTQATVAIAPGARRAGQPAPSGQGLPARVHPKAGAHRDRRGGGGWRALRAGA